MAFFFDLFGDFQSNWDSEIHLDPAQWRKRKYGKNINWLAGLKLVGFAWACCGSLNEKLLMIFIFVILLQFCFKSVCFCVKQAMAASLVRSHVLWKHFLFVSKHHLRLNYCWCKLAVPVILLHLWVGWMYICFSKTTWGPRILRLALTHHHHLHLGCCLRKLNSAWCGGTPTAKWGWLVVLARQGRNSNLWARSTTWN